MKYLTSLLLTFCLVGPLLAQDEDPYKELLFLIIDGDYEKAASKAERYTDNDKTRRDPRPNIYASMAYYEMSKDEEFKEDYPRAFRDAIKYAYKARRYDRDDVYMPEHERYLNELKAEVMKEARFHYDSENWRKSTTYSKYVSRIDPKDISALLLKGTAEVKGRNAYQAKSTFEEADELLKEFKPSQISMEGKDAYRFAVIEYAKLMKEEGTKDKAQPYLEAVSVVLEDDPEFSRFYETY